MEQPSKPALIQKMSLLPLGIYLCSFVLPTIELGEGNIASGARAFLLGFLGSFLDIRGHNWDANITLKPVLFLTWAANPLFWCGMVQALRGKSRSAALLGAAAMVLSGLFAAQVWLQSRASETPPVNAPLTVVNPDGTKKVAEVPPAIWRANTPYGNILYGYYVWWLSMALLAATGSVGALRAYIGPDRTSQAENITIPAHPDTDE